MAQPSANLRFNTDSRAHLRSSPPWHPLAHIIRALPRAIADAIAELELSARPQVLDMGCAERPYRSMLPPDAEYVGADLPGNAHADLEMAEDGSVPAASGSFDVVLSTQVLEHVEEPATYLRECHRVLRPGGQLLLSTHGIMVWHPDPVDYWRWTLSGLERQITSAGFSIVSARGVMGLSATGIQLFQDGVLGRLPRWLRPVFTVMTQTAVRLFDRIESPKNKTYNALVYVLIAEKVADGSRDVI